MDRIRSLFQRKADEREYAPLTNDDGFQADEERHEDGHTVPFSWLEYAIFVWLGVAMLWAWYAQHPRPGRGDDEDGAGAGRARGRRYG